MKTTTILILVLLLALPMATATKCERTETLIEKIQQRIDRLLQRLEKLTNYYDSECSVVATTTTSGTSTTTTTLRDYHCESDRDCKPTEYCTYIDNCNYDLGVCTPYPYDGCSETVIKEICGCDGVIYMNECFLRLARQSYTHPQECGLA